MTAPKLTVDANERKRAKQQAAACFDDALDAVGLSNKEVGEALGVSSSRVLALRSDDPDDTDATPNVADLILVSEPVFTAWLAQILVARRARHGEPVLPSLENQALRVLAADAVVAQQVATALADGVITPPEAAELDSALNRREVETGRLRTLLAARRAR